MSSRFMKNKKLNMLLLPLVGGIWVILLLRMFGTGGDPVPEPSVPIKEATSSQPEVVFVLKEKYRDPFLDHFGTSTNTSSNQKSGSISRQIGSLVKKEAEEVVLHEFRYHGAVSKVNSQKAITGILSIDGQMHMLSLGLTSSDVEVLEISMTHIKFKFDQKVYEVEKE